MYDNNADRSQHAKLNRVTKQNPCPVCDGPDWCRVAADGRYAVCNRIESTQPARGAGGGWIHWLSEETPRQRNLPRARATQTAPPASPEVCDAVYRGLLSVLSLKTWYFETLLRRGFTKEQLDRLEYRTLDLEGRSKVCDKLRASGLSLSRVPGFYQKANFQPYWTVAGSPGLLIPCRAPDGRIRGLRIRPDKSDGGGKYRWFSSAGRPDGASSGARCHVARPIGPEAEPGTVWITEGEIKADLAAGWLLAPCISIPGVSLWSRALPDVVELLPGGGRIVVAMDSDWRTKPSVHAAAWSLVRSCEALGYQVEVATWDATLKGLDDLLAAGQQPVRHPPDTLPPPEWRSRLRSKILTQAPKRMPSQAIELPKMRSKLENVLCELFRSP